MSNHTKSAKPGHTCFNLPSHVNTMVFDMTTEDGRIEFEYARLGSNVFRVIREMEREMRNCTKHEAAPFDSDALDDGMCYRETFNSGIIHATQYWRDRLRDLRHDYNVPLEV